MKIIELVKESESEINQSVELIKENSAVGDYVGCKAYISILMSINEKFAELASECTEGDSLYDWLSLMKETNNIQSKFEELNEIASYAVLMHTSLSAADSSLIKTIDFIESRYMWDQDINIKEMSKLKFFNEFDLSTTELIYGVSAMLRAKLKNEVYSEFTIKPLFKFNSLMNAMRSVIIINN